MWAINIEQLSKSFGAVRALDGLSLQVPKHSVFGYLGPNGAGKTTTIRLLLGLLEASGGSAQVMGYDTRTQAAEIRTLTGALLEHSGIYEKLSVEDNLEYYGRIYQMTPSARGARIRELLVNMGLWERRKDKAGKLSKGMKQKLAVARALLHRPQLVLLDEPTAGLDVQSAAALRKDLALLAAQDGVTIFLTTHNMAEAENLCSQVAVIRDGRLLAVGHPDELRARTSGSRIEIAGRGFSEEIVRELQNRPGVAAARVQNQHLLIDMANGSDASPLVTFLVGEGAQIEEVRRGAASLEETFLKLMEEES